MTNTKQNKFTQRARLERIGASLIDALGENVTREGLIDTPRRFADYWLEFANYEPGKLDTVFESVHTDQMVVVSGMRVWSMCEHHLLPFWCDVAIGVIVEDRLLGLSKFARIAHKHAKRLQIQERLTHGIQEEIAGLIDSENVAVVGMGEHLCMTMRGIETPHRMMTSAMGGVFRENAETRAEFLALAQLGK